MLVICYGMPKSGSTLAYELVRGVLMHAGHDQRTIRTSTGLKRRGRGNHLAAISRPAIENAMAEIGSAGIVAAKTHLPLPLPLFGWIEAMQAERQIQVIASYRDPREMILSMQDHSARSRARGRPGYAHIEGLAETAEHVERAIAIFRRWAALRGTLRLYYDTVAFAPECAIGDIERTLGVTCDRAAALRHAFKESKTQKNKAIPKRFESDMDEETRRSMSERFATFIDRICDKAEPEYFEQERKHLLQVASRPVPRTCVGADESGKER